MDRVNRIINNSKYINCYKQNEDCEKDRIYCKHNMTHFLDVARLAWIINLEENLNISKEIVYATALLHDIGKFKQYLNKIPHEIASAKIANDILKECGFQESEIDMILSAIETHRDANVMHNKNLNGILYRADKMSRSCFACSVNASCNWSLEKKNLELKY